MSTVDLSQLPPPEVVETLSFEQIRDEIIAQLQDLDSDLFASLAPGDPVYAQILLMAYREVFVRARVNDAAKAVLLPSSFGTNLDSIGAFWDVPRLTLIAADPLANPPVEEVKEEDDDYRASIHETPRALGTGTKARYERVALQSDTRVSSVYANSPNPAELVIEWAPDVGVDPADYTAIGQSILSAIQGLDSDGFENRLLTDQVTQSRATATTYSVTAHLHLFPGPDPAEVVASAVAAVNQLGTDLRAVRVPVPLSSIYRALQQTGVAKVDLSSPVANLPSAALVYYELAAAPTVTSETAVWLL